MSINEFIGSSGFVGIQWLGIEHFDESGKGFFCGDKIRMNFVYWGRI